MNGKNKSHSSDKPLVSIVTVVLNLIQNGRLAYFKKMMSSIHEQSYGTDHIEHIIIDGASTDGTIEVIEDYDRRGAVDYWISESDSGIFNAMNKGVRAASGSLINFMNSDDYFMQNAVELCVQAIVDSEADFCYAKSDLVDESDEIVRDVWLSAPEFLYFGMPGSHQTMLVKKSWFDRCGLFDESLRIFGDWDFIQRIYLNGARPVFVNEKLVNFRSKGASENWFNNPNAQNEKRIIIKKNYLEEISLSEQELRQLESFLVNPLSGNFDTYKILDIVRKTSHSEKFSSDILCLLSYSILNTSNPDVHGRGRKNKSAYATRGMAKQLMTWLRNAVR